MTLSDPRRALLPLALALACATTAMPVLAQGLQTSFEPGEPAPTQAAGALQVTIGNGPAAPYTAKRNAGYSGLHALHYSCLLYTSPSPRDGLLSRMPSSA